MSDLLFFAATPAGPQPLPVPANSVAFEDLFDGIELGVYSALRTFGRYQFLDLDEHLARSHRSIARLGWRESFDEALLRANLDAACRAQPWDDARVRFDILPPDAPGPRLLIALRPMPAIPAAYYEAGVSADFAPGLQRDDPLVKDGAFGQRRRSYTVGGDVYEYLLLDPAGYILEGATSNFYGVRDGVLHTAGSGVLAGVTRKLLLAVAADLGIPVNLDPIHRDELAQLSEAALSSSSRALIPIVNIAGQTIGSGRPGPMCRRLLAAYNERVPQLIRPAV